MTRLELEPYVDCGIFVSSVPTGKKRYDYFLHQNVDLTVLVRDEKTVIEDNLQYRNVDYQPLKLDHVWVSPNVVKSGNILQGFLKRFDKIFPHDKTHFIAKVEKYTRNDGTTDYGFAQVNNFEKFVYQMLITEYVVHAYFLHNDVKDFYDFYRKRLTNSPLTIDVFFEEYSDHIKKHIAFVEKYPKYVDEMFDVQENNKIFPNRFAQDRYCAVVVLDNVRRKLINTYKKLETFAKKYGKQIDKRVKKKQFVKQVKSRAKGFGTHA